MAFDGLSGLASGASLHTGGPGCSCAYCSAKVDAGGATDGSGPASAVTALDSTGAAPKGKAGATTGASATGDTVKLSAAAEQELAKLKQRDREVRAHEAAHQAASGGMAGAASFTYQTGPDGQRYAVGGEVQITTGASNDPRETLQQAQTVERAALAPAQPSGQDLAVAASARAAQLQAQRDVRASEQADAEGGRAAVEGVGGPPPAGVAPSGTPTPPAKAPEAAPADASSAPALVAASAPPPVGSSQESGDQPRPGSGRDDASSEGAARSADRGPRGGASRATGNSADRGARLAAFTGFNAARIQRAYNGSAPVVSLQSQIA